MSFTVAGSLASFINIKLKKTNQSLKHKLECQQYFYSSGYFKGERERNMLGLCLKTFLAQLQEVGYNKKCSTSPFGTSTMDSTTNHHLPAVSDLNQNKFRRQRAHLHLTFQNQGITVHVVSLT